MPIENAKLVARIKALLAPDGGAEREHNARDGSLGFGLMHYALVTNLRPQRALVIGSRYGFVPGIIALAMQANGGGRVDFVDANYDDAVDGFERAYGGVGHWALGGAGFNALAVSDTVSVHIMRSEEFFDRCDKTYGYVYLDGDHGYDGCRYDLEQSLARLDRGGIVTLHDVLVDASEFGVRRVFAEIPSNAFDKFAIPIWPGLGIVRPNDRYPGDG